MNDRNEDESSEMKGRMMFTQNPMALIRLVAKAWRAWWRV